MKLVNAENGVSVPDKNGKPVTLHSECFRAWLNVQVENELAPNFQPISQPLQSAVGAD